MDTEVGQSKQERSRTRWTASLDRIFADLVVKQIQLGNRPNNVFDKKTWNNIRDEFNKQTDLNFNNNQLRKHLDVLRTRFYNLKSAYDQNDFAVMEDSCCIGFDLWEEIGAQPRPELIKIKDCPIYDQLCTIFTDSSADGKYAQSSHFEGLDKVVGNDSSLASCQDGGSTHTDNPSTSRLAQNNSLSEKFTKSIGERKRKRPSETQPSLDHNTKEEEMSEAMAGAMLDMVAAWKSRRTIVTKRSENKFSITNCIKALDEIEDIEEWLYFAALDLFEDPNLRETFISLKSSKIRLTWLRGKCNKPPTTSVQALFPSEKISLEEVNKMIGSLLTRGLVMVFGYAYPAYECYKTVEMNKPDIDQLRFWCQYWILVAVLTVCERIGDTFISWVPMYSEAKLAFYIYLWYPKTRGTSYVYDSFFRPYVAKHENEIDRNLLELRTRAGDMAVLYWQRAASYGQTRIFEILQYVASQSTPRPQNPQAQGARASQPSGVPNRQASSKTQSAQSSKAQTGAKQPTSPTSSTSSSQHQKEVAEDVGPSKAPSQLAKPPTRSASLNSQKADTASESTSQSAETETEATQTESLPPSPENEGANPPPKETLMEESIRVTRGRLRKTRSAAQ
ncbi:hypothetical protein V6N11_039066 [Hibiscus sabdariffa]|uniref:Myb/SANT-like domain-containing protein n=1 Tax=Hibiscus sabdariffa TaxID=183260 RepID=A0ABR2SLU2_9ROSI